MQNPQVFIQKERKTGHWYIFCNEDSCKIYATQSQGTKNYYVKVGSFVEEISGSSIYIRINYPQNTSYLFEKQLSERVFSISFNKNQEGLDQWESLVNNHAVILDFGSENISKGLNQKLTTQCPDSIETKDISISNKSIIEKFGKNIGVLAGKISTVVVKPLNNATSSLTERAGRGQRESTSSETPDVKKSKWQNFKQSSQKINQSLANMIKPAINAYNGLTSSIGDSFYASNNKVVKAVRCTILLIIEYSLAFSDALNDGQKSAIEAHNEGEFKDEQVSNIELKEKEGGN